MGLDITAYSRVRKISDDEFDPETVTEGPYERRLKNGDCVSPLNVNPDFPGRADGLEPNAYYVNEGEEFGFGAGSYSGYNSWREDLARMVGTSSRAVWANPQPGPFTLLIDFSDCEGVIGPVTSAKLHQDFVEWHGRAVVFSHTLGEWVGSSWLQKYDEWTEAFRLAAMGGFVSFH